MGKKNFKTRDPILATDDQGRPIFGYNKDGVPVCFSRRQNMGDLRCMATMRMHNGRCKLHGGKAVRGPDSGRWRDGKYASYLPKGVANDLIEAANDPNYLELREEIGLNTIRITNLLGQFEKGTDNKTWEKIEAVAQELETLIFSDTFENEVKAAVQLFGGEASCLASFSSKAEQLVRLVKYGRNEVLIHKEIDDAVKTRAMLVNAETKRAAMDRNNMPADQVLALFEQVVGVVMTVFADNPTGLKAFADEIDKLSALSTANPVAARALGGDASVKGMIEPHSVLTETIRNSDGAIDAEYREG